MPGSHGAGSSGQQTYLVLLAEREAVSWVLANQRMAFPASRAADARQLRVGDRLLLYTTRGCFHNPTRDRGRIIAEASVAQAAREPSDPLELIGRTFTLEVGLQIASAAPIHRGVVLSELVERLDVFPNKAAWSARMRRTTLKLGRRDSVLLLAELRPLLIPLSEALSGYQLASSVSARVPT